MNTIDLLNKRVSLRSYKDTKINQEDLDVIINAALRAPTAGNMMLYSMIVVKDQAKKDILAKSCDNQPFIAKSSHILIFVADMRKLYDYFDYCGVESYCQEQGLKYNTPDKSKLFLAAGDAFIAAQNAVVAAEAIGVGTCYIGDIIENFETHKELLKLPNWAIPVAMLTMGYYKDDFKMDPKPRFDKEYVVFDEEYKRLSGDDFEKMYGSKNFPQQSKLNAKNYGQLIYGRKFGADFAFEMEESIDKYLKEWYSQD